MWAGCLFQSFNFYLPWLFMCLSSICAACSHSVVWSIINRSPCTGSLSLWITEQRENMGCEFDHRSPGFHCQPLAAIKVHEPSDEKKVEEGAEDAMRTKRLWYYEVWGWWVNQYYIYKYYILTLGRIMSCVFNITSSFSVSAHLCSPEETEWHVKNRGECL